MTRPFQSHTIYQLEAAVEHAFQEGNQDLLAALARELAHRTVPRARQLAERIADPSNGGMATSLRGTGQVAGPALRRSEGSVNVRSPTPEQIESIDAFVSGASMKINAYAGTGKTSTLEMLSHSTKRRGQYIAFNRSIVSEAAGRFPASVNCSTVHGLAYRSTDHSLRSNKAKMTNKVSANELASLLNLKKIWRVDRERSLQPRSQAYLIAETIRRFCYSTASDFTPDHVPHHGSLLSAPPETLAVVADFALRGARHVWARMINPSDQLPMGHDGYLKLWALGRPRIATDFILLDEAQDTNPVVLEVLREQSAQTVYVGDRYQQIYEWRGAVNAMEEIATDRTTQLTQSFRFGPEIAMGASHILKMLGEKRPLTGNPALKSKIADCNPDAILARTNASVMSALIEALNAGKKPSLVGGTGELMEMLRGVQDLKAGVPSTVPDFFGFERWEDVVEFSDTVEGGHLTTFVNLVQSRGERQLLWALGRIVDEKDGDITISTAHKAKGREWRNVRLLDDFMKSFPEKPGTQVDEKRRNQEREAELRLFYVAFTRAREAIEVPVALLQSLGLASPAIPPVSNINIVNSVEERTIPQASPTWKAPQDWTPKKETPPAEQSPSENPRRKRGLLARLFGL